MPSQDTSLAAAAAKSHTYLNNTLIDSKAHFGDVVHNQRHNIHVRNLYLASTDLAATDPRAWRMITDDVRNLVETTHGHRYPVARSRCGGRGGYCWRGRSRGGTRPHRGGKRRCASKQGKIQDEDVWEDWTAVCNGWQSVPESSTSNPPSHVESALGRLYQQAFVFLRTAPVVGPILYPSSPHRSAVRKAAEVEATKTHTETDMSSQLVKQDCLNQNLSILKFCGFIMAALAGRSWSSQEAWSFWKRISHDPLFPYCSLVVALCIAHLSNVTATIGSLYGLTQGDYFIFEDAFKQELEVPLTHLEHSFIFKGFLKKHYLNTEGQAFVQNDQYNLTLGSRRGTFMGLDQLCNGGLIKRKRRLVMSVWLQVSGLQCLACDAGTLLANDQSEYHCPACKRFYLDTNAMKAYQKPWTSKPPEELHLEEIPEQEVIGTMPETPTSTFPMSEIVFEVGKLQNVDLHVLSESGSTETALVRCIDSNHPARHKDFSFESFGVVTDCIVYESPSSTHSRVVFQITYADDLTWDGGCQRRAVAAVNQLKAKLVDAAYGHTLELLTAEYKNDPIKHPWIIEVMFPGDNHIVEPIDPMDSSQMTPAQSSASSFSGPWTREMDDILLQYHGRLKWHEISERFFHNQKSPNACRKRVSRLEAKDTYRDPLQTDLKTFSHASQIQEASLPTTIRLMNNIKSLQKQHMEAIVQQLQQRKQAITEEQKQLEQDSVVLDLPDNAKAAEQDHISTPTSADEIARDLVIGRLVHGQIVEDDAQASGNAVRPGTVHPAGEPDAKTSLAESAISDFQVDRNHEP